MRSPRLIAGLVALTAVLAACGDSPKETADNTTIAASASTVAPSSTAATATTAGGATATTSPLPTIDCTTASGADATATTVAGAKPTKPPVSVPTTAPTSIQCTDLRAGTGDAAREGDLVLVNYVGVRTADGKEFDNSYDRGEPFPVSLGAGGVIKGWDIGLVGIKAGTRRQLDIPAEFAYGDNPPSTDVIKPGDALTFVIDALAVVHATSPADEPKTDVTGGPNVSEVSTKDLVVGTGTEVQDGQTLVLQLVAYRADTGAKINSTWESGNPQQATYNSKGLLPGMYEGMKGMKVGGRREITIPFMKAFGAAGNENVGLPASTDLIVVIDVFAAV